MTGTLVSLLLATSFSVANRVAVAPPDSAIGVVDFPISCAPDQQTAFNHAVALLHHMTYPQAKSEFEAIAAADPDCAMAYWGIAMSLFQPLWPTRPGPEERMQGYSAAEKAAALGASTERERLFIAAADSFFVRPESADYWSRIDRWAQATETLYKHYPTDHEAMAFEALALLATAPAGGTSVDHQNLAAALLLSIQEGNPQHPGSLHYLIHANDVHGREHESLDLVDRYDNIAPDNPHALHMPTHIYTRLGDWEGVIDGNLKAAEAALAHPAGDQRQYVWDEFPHALEYLVYAYLQRGDDEAAASQIDRLKGTSPLHPTFKTAFHVSSIPARFALERKDWAGAADLEPRPLKGLDWDRFTWPEAITWFARGLGAAHLGHLDHARRALERVEELGMIAESSGETAFARQILVLQHGISAWVAEVEGRPQQAIHEMRAAADLELSTPKHPVTPAPTLPALELLGELYLVQQQPDSALAAFKKSLTLYPNRYNSLLGASTAAEAAGDRNTATTYRDRLRHVVDPNAARGRKLN